MVLELGGRFEAAVLLAVAAGASRPEDVAALLGAPIEDVEGALRRLEEEGLLRVVERRRLLFWREKRLELTQRGWAAVPLARSMLTPRVSWEPVPVGDEVLLAMLAGLAAEAAFLLGALLQPPLSDPVEDPGSGKRNPIVFDPEEWK